MPSSTCHTLVSLYARHVLSCAWACLQVWARVTALRDVKASVNWMYAAKMDSEGADMYDAAIALR